MASTNITLQTTTVKKINILKGNLKQPSQDATINYLCDLHSVIEKQGGFEQFKKFPNVIIESLEELKTQGRIMMVLQVTELQRALEEFKEREGIDLDRRH